MMNFIGYGAVAQDTEEDVIETEIVFYPLISGETEIPNTGSEDEEETTTAEDVASNLFTTSVKKSQTITARWLAEGSNQVNMPSLKQGEQVSVYQYGDTDRYYFKLGHLEKDLRRKEVGVFSFSNKPDTEEEFGEQFDKDSSYTVTIDPKNKLVELKTSTSDGEPVLYTIKIDTKAAIFSIADSKNNSIKLESLKGTLTLDIPTVVFNSKTINMNGSSSITLKTPSAIIEGGKLVVKSTVDFFKACNHKAAVVFNGLSKSKPGRCPCCGEKHQHVLA